MPNDTPNPVPAPSPPPPYACFAEALGDADRLLKYAAEAGVRIDSETREAILRAKTVDPGAWDPKTAKDFLVAFTDLAAELKPVTARSLRACDDKRKTELFVRKYKMMALWLGAPILVFSFASFMTTSLSDGINKKINAANSLGDQVRAEMGTPPDAPANSPSQTNIPSNPSLGTNEIRIITDLQQFTSDIRDVNSHARRLNWFIGGVASEYHLEQIQKLSRTNQEVTYTNFQLQVGLTNFWSAGTNKIALYQHVRTFAQDVVDDVSNIYGALGRCVLPMFYALLGTCVYFLRAYEQQLKARTFVPSHSDTAHFFTAGICGAVVGLFNVTMAETEGVSASPLAVAFLVGYSVDIFFSFLEGFLQIFIKGKDSN